MIRLAFIGLIFTLGAVASPEAYLVESKVQTDLETALSRVVIRESFFVQVATDVTTKTERRLIEGETVLSGPQEDEEEDVEMMPGFVPERVLTKTKKNEEQRQTFRLVDVPTLNVVRVHIGLDETLAEDLVQKVRTMVQNYLSSNYPNRGSANFTRIPMLKPPPKEPEKKEAKEEEPKTPKRDLAEEKPKEPDAWVKEYLPWIAAAFFAICMLFLALILRRDGSTKPLTVKSVTRHANPFRREAYDRFDEQDTPRRKPREEQPASESTKTEIRVPTEEKDAAPMPLEQMRLRFLEHALSRSDAFRLFYLRLSGESQAEIYSALKGPAFDNFLEGINIPKPSDGDVEASDLEEKLDSHFRAFREFSRTKDWQDRQFFGFLNRLNDEQLMTLMHHETPLAICMMLRFLKPAQSAMILDSLSPAKRAEAMAQVNNLQSTPFAEIVEVENRVRETVEKLPTHFFGTPKEDILYWGSVLSEASDQDAILSDVEKTNPGIYPHLKKFRFKLDDLSSVPAPVLKTVLSDVDNEELALAMLTLPENVVKFVLGSVSPQRREFLAEQIASSKGASKETTMEARLNLTKRFREAMA